MPRTLAVSARSRRSPTLLMLSGALAFGIVGLAGTARSQIQLQCVADPLPAECTSFAFDIQLTSVTDPDGLLGAVQPGDIVSGVYTVFDGFPDLDPDPSEGFYLNAVECVRLDLGDRILTALNQPAEFTPTPSPTDPGLTVMNDIPQQTGSFTLFSDSVTLGMGGPAATDILAVPGPVNTLGGGAFAFGYGTACVSGVQSPCPPTVVTSDAFPSAPGDTTGLNTAQMGINYVTTANHTAIVDSNLLAIDPTTPPIPCPEPTLLAGFSTGLVLLVVLGRRRHTLG